MEPPPRVSPPEGPRRRPGRDRPGRRPAARAGAQPLRTVDAWWSLEPAELLRRLDAAPGGLSSAAAAGRLAVHGRNEIRAQQRPSRLRVLWHQVRSPLLLLLLFAACVSVLTGAWTDAMIVLAILLASIGIGYAREYRAQRAAELLRQRVRIHCSVLRDGRPQPVPREEIVPGDVVLLAAGSLVPADAVVLAGNDLHVSEAVLTGESFPVGKRPGVLPAATPLAQRDNCVHLGTNVRSGTARCLVVATGAATAYGSIAARLLGRAPETEFDRGLRRFGHLLTRSMLVLVLLVFAAQMLRHRPVDETLLFAIALAVGLSPELLPAILTVNLARGAEEMARRGVLVRRLDAIENLGSMDVLCTDKTGTLTQGVVELEGAYDPGGAPAPDVLELAGMNARLETGLRSPLDDAILRAHPGAPRVRKRAEIPFDFTRKRVSVVVHDGAAVRLVTKGAFDPVLAVCTHLRDGTPLDAGRRDALARLQAGFGDRGMRVLAVAERELPDQERYDRRDEAGLAFAGFLAFLDRPREGVAGAIGALARLGVAIKLITGDNRRVAVHVAGLVGLPAARVLSGAELDALHPDAFAREVERTDLFVEVDPDQKERIIVALGRQGHVVGFLGDGVNDAPAMHAADTSLSVQQAVDVAREAADFVLLERDLDVIRAGIEAGRRTFANTMKYVLTTMSANLGNMVSMAATSLFLPFLPLLAGQILLNNLLSDLPAIGLAGDSVDPELVARPRRWDVRFIGRFMVEFGILSSVFDFLTFAALLLLFSAGEELFRTAWFVESLVTELAIALVVRTRRPCWRSRPGGFLLGATLVLVPVAFAIPFLPVARLLGFTPVPSGVLAALLAIAVLYVAAAEVAKRWFYRHSPP